MRQRPLNLDAFKEFCIVDIQLSESTTNLYVRQLGKFQRFIRKSLTQVRQQDIRSYFKCLKEKGEFGKYRNCLAALKHLYRDYLKVDIITDFKFPRSDFKPKTVPNKEQLQAFYRTLTKPRDQALFLMFASSGLRHGEMLSLKISNVRFDQRLICPEKTPNKSKHVWLSFYNSEAEQALKRYLSIRKDDDSRIFPVGKVYVNKRFRRASEISGVKITPQRLRDWFCCEMGELGVPDRYVGAYCGRTPKSVLARYYSDYSPGKLKRIYDKSGLKILS